MEQDNAWALILARIHGAVQSEDFRRWFSVTSYASDSGDQVSVWVPSYAHRAHLMVHFLGTINQSAAAIGRPGLRFRFLVAGFGDEDEEDE